MIIRSRWMVNPVRFRYLDSSVFVAFLNNEMLPTSAVAPRAEVARRILAEAEAGEYGIVTSVLTVAEVRRASQAPSVLHGVPGNAGLFGWSLIRLENLDLTIALASRDLGERYGLKPPDAIHLATALQHNCYELLVWDDDFVRRVNRIPLPGLRVCEPY